MNQPHTTHQRSLMDINSRIRVYTMFLVFADTCTCCIWSTINVNLCCPASNFDRVLISFVSAVSGELSGPVL